MWDLLSNVKFRLSDRCVYKNLKSQMSVIAWVTSWITTVSTHCDCLLTVHLIYTMKYGFWPLKNRLILLNSKMLLIMFLKGPSESLCPGASFHQLGPLGRVGLVVTKSVCLSVYCPLPMQFLCEVGRVQSVPCPWTGAMSISISILSRALKMRMCSGFRSQSWSQHRVEP